jgi:UDP-glucose 4-epimerase
MLTIEASRGAHALVTGGAGFIGSHLCDLLLQRGFRIAVVDDLSSGSLANLPNSSADLTFEQLCVGAAESRERLGKLVRESSIVFHLAGPVGVPLAQADPGATVQSTVLAGAQIVELCRQHRRPILFTSSSEVYGCADRSALAEDSPLALSIAPRFSYAVAKLAVEHMVNSLHRRDGISSWVVRLFNIAGPRQRPAVGVMSAFAAALADGHSTLQIYGGGDQTRCFLHVKDAVAGFVSIANCPELRGRATNVGGGEPITIRALASRMLAECAHEKRCSYSSYADFYGDDFVPVLHRHANTRLLRESTGWSPRFDLTDIIRDCIRYAARGKEL